MKKTKSNKNKLFRKTVQDIKEHKRKLAEIAWEETQPSPKQRISDHFQKVLDGTARSIILGESMASVPNAEGWERYAKTLVGMPTHQHLLYTFVTKTLPSLELVDLTTQDPTPVPEDVINVISVKLNPTNTDCTITLLRTGLLVMDYYWSDSLVVIDGRTVGTRYGSMQLNLKSYLEWYKAGGVAHEFKEVESTDRVVYNLPFLGAFYTSEGVYVEASTLSHLSWLDLAYLIRVCMQVSQNIFER